MLQIISGKFFKGSDRHIHEGKGILYSNFSWISKIETCVATLEPVNPYRDVSSYVLVYTNQIEKRGPLVRTGDAEILEQFQNLAIFGLRAYFAPFREEVERICRRSASGGTEIYAPSQLIQRFFTPGTHGSQEEVTEFIEIVDGVIGLRRQNYLAVTNALKTIRDSLLAVNYNVDLSYSMLVYCLESLAQEFGNISVTWEDFEDSQRESLDPILNTLDSDKADSIKSILMASAHLRLRKRFVQFVSEHLSDTFFTEEAKEVNPALRRSHLERALTNAYLMRSKYVHRLSPILHQLRIPDISRQDTFSWDGQPYLTLSGLIRVCLHVLKSFIRKSEKVDTEDVNWSSQIPGTVTLRMAPQYWIWKTEGFIPQHAASKFSGLLDQVCAAYARKEPVTDLSSLMEIMESKIPQATKNQRVIMLAMYWLYNAIISDEAKRPNWEAFLEQHAQYLATPSIEMMIVSVLLRGDLPWEFEVCVNAYMEFSRKRFWKGVIEVPTQLEISLLATIANKALMVKNHESHRWLLKTAIYESAGKPELQQLLQAALNNEQEIDLHEVLG